MGALGVREIQTPGGEWIPSTLAGTMGKRLMLDWIEPDSWAAFVEMRRKIKAPLTPYAEKLILRELCKLKAAGNDPQACLDQSIMNSWRDVFPLRDKGISKVPSHTTWQPEKGLTEAEQVAANEARRAAMSAVRRARA
jgi:hypothetical protein